MDNKLNAFPLITIDPYFSYWSFSNRLNSSNTKHWTGKIVPMTGDIVLDGISYRFMGKGKKIIKQIAIEVTPLITTYTFQNELLTLKVSFWSPAFLDKPELFSRPCSYIDVAIESRDGKKRDVQIIFSFDESFVYDKKRDSDILGDCLLNKKVNVGYMSKRRQGLLEVSGDDLRINWGYLLVSGKHDLSTTGYTEANKRSTLHITLDLSIELQSFIVVSYDDVASLNYFGDIRTGFWRTKYASIIDAIEAAHEDHDNLLVLAHQKDKSLLKDARLSGGYALETIITCSYRQTIAAHKASFDKGGNLIMISKENFSNGCAATVDITYPSIPLFLLENPELVIGMVRPIIKAMLMPTWVFDFAPHDAGRYPIVTGNVYGMADQFSNNKKKAVCITHSNEVFPPYHYYSNDESIFDIDRQMPVEECGNMLIVVYTASRLINNRDFLIEHLPLFDLWVKYLEKHGKNPGNQLCTDDFAGHLASNANLALKSIFGIEAYARINKMIGHLDIYKRCHSLAGDYAKAWLGNAQSDQRTSLTLANDEGWSLKYNLIWDRVFSTFFFNDSVYEKEIEWYLSQQNKFGVPLDSRATYTKSDWQVWVACLTDNLTQRKQILKPIAKFATQSKSRVPFCDWYDTITGFKVGFQARSVQGGCFAPIMLDKLRNLFALDTK